MKKRSKSLMIKRVIMRRVMKLDMIT